MSASVFSTTSCSSAAATTSSSQPRLTSSAATSSGCMMNGALIDVALLAGVQLRRPLEGGEQHRPALGERRLRRGLHGADGSAAV